MGIKSLAGRGAVAAWFLFSAAAMAQAPTVPVVTVRAATATAGLLLDGRVEALRQSTIAAQLAGNVLELPVRAGDRVRSGQLLGRIDAREADSGVLRGDAAVAQASAEWRNASLQAERTRELRRQGFVSRAALDVAETQLQATQAGVQQARAARTQARVACSFAELRAPFDGIVLATHVEPGELATPGRPLLTLYQPGAMRASVHVPASSAALARAARETEVQLPDGRWVAATRRTEMPSTDAVSQTNEWRLELPAAIGSALPPGQAVRVRFTGAVDSAAAVPALRVPAGALVRRGELTAVYVVQDGAFVLRAVRAGAQRGDGTVDIVAGLKAGDSIASEGVRAGLAGAVPQR